MRFAKAAERQGGAAEPNALGENTMFKARKSRSATDGASLRSPPTPAFKDSNGSPMLGIRLSGKMMV